MKIETRLKSLGFTPFVPLRKALRDQKKRLTFVGFLDGEDFGVILVEDKGEWEVEKTSIMGANLQRLFSENVKENDLYELLEFIQLTFR